MSGKLGRSGRKRNPKNVLHFFNEQFDLNSYELVEAVIQKALTGDKDMLVYCFDRRLGKPKQTQVFEGEIGLTAPQLRAFAEETLKLQREYQQKLLVEGSFTEKPTEAAVDEINKGKAVLAKDKV